jgi:hypothetical protein
MKAKTTTAVLACLVLGLAAASAGAQTPADDETAPQEPVRKIRVLENPYDIASFYRSHQGEYFGLQASGVERYPIAGFYRQGGGQGYGYSRFWTLGYSGRGRSGMTFRYRRRIGDNGDLYLFAPFLAPVGPLSSVFLGDR